MADTPGKAAPATVPPPSPGKAGKPTTLLDVQEVEWITRELERLLARESGGGGAGVHHHHHRRKRGAKVSPPAQDQKLHAKKGGFLTDLLGKHAASICGDDTVTGAAAGVSGRRRRGCGGFREVDKL